MTAGGLQRTIELHAGRTLESHLWGIINDAPLLRHITGLLMPAWREINEVKRRSCGHVMETKWVKCRMSLPFFVLQYRLARYFNVARVSSEPLVNSMSSNKLRASAAEFRPSFLQSIDQKATTSSVVQQPSCQQQNSGKIATTPGQQQQQQQEGEEEGGPQPQQHAANQNAACEDEWQHSGCHDADVFHADHCIDEWDEEEGEGDAEYVEGYVDWSLQLHDTQQQQHQWYTADQMPPMSLQDAVELLHSWYPTYPKSMLQQLVGATDGNSVEQAARIISDMEMERRRARIKAAASNATSSTPGSSSLTKHPTASKQQHFSFEVEQFPTLGSSKPSSSSSNTAATHSARPLKAPANWAGVASKPAVAPDKVSGTLNNSSSSSSSKPAATAAAAAPLQPPGAHSAEGAVPWVETGEAVSREYAAARAEASDHARVRNACFHQATLAYLAGDKALAKELSAKGKAAAEAMWAAHERASSQIYETRNAQLQQRAARRLPGAASAAAVIDLHGLHVQEMMKVLPQRLAALSAQQVDSVSVIVGVGKHTKGPPSARMAPAVEALVKELGYGLSQPQPGLMKVRLR